MSVSIGWFYMRVSMIYRQHQQKTFAMISGFWPVRGWGFEWIYQKRRICDKNLFSNNIEWSSKKLPEMTSADIKTNVK